MYILNFFEAIFVERLYNSTLITARVLTSLTMEKNLEVLQNVLWVFDGLI